MITIRLIALALCGACLGGQLNRAIYRWAWHPRSISPWSAPPPNTPKRHWRDCLPIVGWWWMRRESTIHGRYFWLRPILIELGCGLGMAWLYQFELSGGLLISSMRPYAASLSSMLHAQYLSHLILLSLMTIATFIDFDEKTIPDQITVPGTLAGLLLAYFLPNSLLPIPAGMGTVPIAPLRLTSPNPWPLDSWLDGREGLACGLACWLFWGYALIPKTIYWKGGWVRCVRYWLASMLRFPGLLWFGVIAAVGGVGIVWAWSVGGIAWATLLSALTGLAFGVSLIWIVRIVFSYVLQQEAMGFGDVTLMGMIGAFLGWQSVMIIFFLGPLVAVTFAVGQWLMTRRHDLPFGPYLCMASLIWLLGWPTFWLRFELWFGLGWILIMTVGIALIMMAGLLLIYVNIRDRLT